MTVIAATVTVPVTIQDVIRFIDECKSPFERMAILRRALLSINEADWQALDDYSPEQYKPFIDALRNVPAPT